MRIIFASLVIILATPAAAQVKGRPTDPSPQAAKPVDTAQKKAEAEAYQRALKSIPEPKANADPWSGAR